MTDAPITLEVLGERIGGLSVLVSQGFDNVQRQLNAVGDLPVKVEGLERDFSALKDQVDKQYKDVCRDIEELKSDSRSSKEWRRGSLPMIALTVVLALVALASLLSTVIHH